MNEKKSKVYKGLYYFCLLGVIVMIIPTDESDTMISGAIFYGVLSYIFRRKYIKYKPIKSIGTKKYNFNLKKKSPSDYHGEPLDTNYITENDIEIDFITSDAHEKNDYYNEEDVPEISFKYGNSFYQNYFVKNDSIKKAILLEHFKKSGYIYNSNSQYPKYFIEKYGITDISKRYISYYEEGLLEKASYQDMLMSLLKTELESLCSILDIPKSGNKLDIAKRIVNTDNFEEYVGPFFGSETMVILSNLGKDWLHENDDLIKISKRSEISSDDYMEIKNRLLESGIDPTFEQVLIIGLHDQIRKYFSNHDYEFVKRTYDEISIIHLSQDNISESLDALLSSLIIELSGVESYGNIKTKDNIMYSLPKYSKLLDYDEYDVKESTKRSLSKLNLPYQRYSNEVLDIIVMDYYKNGTIDFNDYTRFEIKAPISESWGQYWARRKYDY